MKKMYKQPETEILSVSTEQMMQQGPVVSVNPNGGGGGVAGAPRRGDIIE